MGNTKAISNEQIIAALLLHGSVKEAAAAAGTSPRTIYDRMRNQDFLEEYAHTRADILRQAVNTLNSNLTEAIETIAEIMRDQEVNPATRLQASQMLISQAGKFSDRLHIAENRAKLQGDPLNLEFTI